MVDGRNFLGRPKWARIFQESKKIWKSWCFLAPPIAADLKKCSAKYSDDRVAKRKEDLTMEHILYSIKKISSRCLPVI